MFWSYRTDVTCLTETHPLTSLPVVIICILRSYEITFSGITLANRNRLGRNFTREVGSRQTPVQTSDAKLKQNGGKKRIFITKTTHRFIHFPAADFHKICTENVYWCGHEFLCCRTAKLLS